MVRPTQSNSVTHLPSSLSPTGAQTAQLISNPWVDLIIQSRGLVGWVWLVLVAFPALLADGAAPQSPASAATTASKSATSTAAEIEARIQQAIGDLQANQYVVRRQAFFQIWAEGAVALPQVRAAMSVKEPATAAAARALELLLRLEISPRDNDELAELANLSKGDISTTLVSLANKGHWRLARELLKTNEAVWTNKRSDIQYQGLCGIVQAAFEQGDSSLAWPAISLLLEPSYRAYLPLQALKAGNRAASGNGSTLDNSLSMNLELSADQWQLLSEDERALHLAYAGKTDEAWALNTSSQTRFRIALYSGRWSGLKEPAMKSVLLGSTNDSLTSLAQQAAAAYLADDLVESDRLLKSVHAELDKLEGSLGLQTTPELLDALAICGDGSGLDRLLTAQPSRANLNYYKSALRYELGLQAFGLHAEMDHDDFQSWTRRALQKLPRTPIPFAKESEISSYCDLASYLVAIGWVQQGRHLCQKLVEHALGQNAQDRYEALYYVSRLARQSQLRDTMLQEIDKQDGKINGEVRKLMMSLLWTDSRQVTEFLWETMPEGLARTEEGSRRWQTLDRLQRYDRQLIEPVEQARLVERWLDSALAESQKSAEDVSTIGPQLAKIALQLDLQRTGASLLRASASRSSPAELAEVLMLNNSLETASKLWERAIAQDPSQHAWIRQQISTLRLLGEPERAAEYEASIWLRPLRQSPAERSETYATLAQEFFNHGDYQLAREYGLAASTLFDFNQGDLAISAELLSRINLELEDFQAGARAIRAALINLFMSRTTLQNARDLEFEYRHYIAAQDYLLRTAADIESGEIDQALERARRFAQLRPGGIELCEHSYPRLIKAGAEAQAKQMLDSWSERMRTHLSQWPKDAGYHNNFAWMLARCNQHLDEAREHAELAVELSEREPTYVDTLAEIEFRQGHVDRAIELAKECIAADPEHAHYKIQLHRFRTER